MTMALLACTPCRSRKVACDRRLPSCTRCLCFARPCEYPTRKSAKGSRPSRLNLLDVRLGDLESSLSQGGTLPPDFGKTNTNEHVTTTDQERTELTDGLSDRDLCLSQDEGFEIPIIADSRKESFFPDGPLQQKLYDRYFEHVYPAGPIIHKPRFFRALEGDSIRVPPIALRYAMWAIAAMGSSQYQHLAEKLYKLGRKHADDLEMQSGEKDIATSHAQCWFLLALYEATRAYYARAFISVGRCVRLVQMLSLHLLDLPGEEEKAFQRGRWAEKEEGRRVFWGAYLADRWASSISGNPIIMRDQEIYTNLPTSEPSFWSDIEEIGVSVEEAGSANSMTYLSPFAGTILTATILGRCIEHINTYKHCKSAQGYSKYWSSHRELDTSICLTFLNLPTHLRVASKEQNVQVVLCQFNIHVAVILLHQLAIKVATDQEMPNPDRQNSFYRCLSSALEIKSIVCSVKDLKILADHMWLAFSIYKAAGVFIEDLLRPDSCPTSAANLGLLISALKQLNLNQSYVSFFAQRLESIISTTGIPCHIPVTMGGMT